MKSENIQDNEKLTKMTWIFLTAGFFLLLIFCRVLFWSEGRITPASPSALDSDTEVMWEIESLYYDENSHYYTINGWAFVPDEEIDNYQCRLLLEDQETGAFIQLPSMMTNREDLKERFPEMEGSFQAMETCGFYSVFQRDELEGELSRYVIYIQYQNNGRNILIATQRALDQF